MVIAHRLSTVMAADRIHVLDSGKVVESGNHDTLLARGGTYTRLYELQFAERSTEHKSGEPAEDSVPVRLGS